MTEHPIAHRTLRFPDGRFTLYTAQYGSWTNDQRIVFRVRVDRDPHERAGEKGIRDFDRLVPASTQEIAWWLESHPGRRRL